MKQKHVTVEKDKTPLVTTMKSGFFNTVNFTPKTSKLFELIEV